MAINRREAREAVFGLLFETEFKPGEACEDIFALSVENRDAEEDGYKKDEYIRSTYFGVCAHRAELDQLINDHAKGWKTSRISRVSRSILRLSVYEMCYTDIPKSVSINEAVELCKKYDEDSARAFVNGVLNGVKNSIEGGTNA